jgi:hypothetical protein
MNSKAVTQKAIEEQANMSLGPRTYLLEYWLDVT